MDVVELLQSISAGIVFGWIIAQSIIFVLIRIWRWRKVRRR